MGIMRGKAKWAKIVGKPVRGYNEDELEWTFDLEIDEETQKALLREGMSQDYLKENKDGNTYIKFVRKSVTREGQPAKPFSIVDHHGEDWNGELIGNGSTLNVLYALNEVKSKGKMKLKPSAIKIQVWDLVKYEGGGTFPTRKDDDKPKAESWADE